MDDSGEFERLVSAIVARWFRQNAEEPPPVAESQRFAAQLYRLVDERGLPPPLAPGELGSPGGMSDEECAPLVARVTTGNTHPRWTELGRQFVKACFYPEFRTCRDSFREVARDGTCRRQQLERVRSRISGTHCVDCPHWVALSPANHVAYVRREWIGAPAALDVNRDAFLPEDFRALRLWLHAAARE